MTDFITRLDFRADPNQLMADLRSLIPLVPDWETHRTNQIGLRCRPGASDPWNDAVGSLTDPDGQNRRASEADFTEWCPAVPGYTRAVLEALASVMSIRWGRIRFMRTMPSRGLTMHRDTERRFHMVLETNPSAILGECYQGTGMERCRGYHLPRDGHWYLVDTRREHFAYNGGREPRIHLVACAIEG